jgi:ABC-type nitrate/sulfonate/bicarbonate transport system substrate-binding protein
MARITANFPFSAGSLTMWVAEARGFFAEQGVDIAFEQARGSASQYHRVMNGDIQIFTTLMENIIAYEWGEGEATFDPVPDAFVFMGSNLGYQCLMARPAITQIADLKGCTLAASGLRTGNVLVLYGMLARHGLQLDRDFKVVAVGGGPVTVAALDKAGADAALMGPPNDTEAKARGFNVLGDTTSTFGGYQSSVYTARRSWAKAHETELVGVIAALIKAHRLIFADKTGAIEVLRARLPSLSADEGETVYAGLVSPLGGINPDGRLDEKYVKTVLDLRREFALAPHPGAQPRDFYDLSYYRTAVGRI